MLDDVVKLRQKSMSIVSKAGIWLLAPTTCLLTLLEEQYHHPNSGKGQHVSVR
jgi:hypothetical protein